MESKMWNEKMAAENQRHYHAVREINNAISDLLDKLEKENVFHRRKTEEYKKNYKSAITAEEELTENLKNRFESKLPYDPMFNFYTEFEILQHFSAEEFWFMREAKLLMICGVGEVIFYTTNWR